MSETARRYPEIDAIKAAGIVTIVLIHALRSPWDAGVSELERWLGHVTRFGVPGFLFASGFLYAGAPADSVTTGRRLRRRFDRENMAFGHDGRLADIETAERAYHAERDVHVCLVVGGRGRGG